MGNDITLPAEETTAGAIKQSTDDPVNHPPHYTTRSMEVIDIIRIMCEDKALSPFEGYCLGNAIKYLARYKHKGGAESLQKAQRYVDMLIAEQKEGAEHERD